MVTALKSIMEGSSIEAWILLSFGILVTILRTYARARTTGLKAIQADDYLAWVAAVSLAVGSVIELTRLMGLSRLSTR